MDVRPEDSISNVDSRESSTMSRRSRSSNRSSASTKARCRKESDSRSRGCRFRATLCDTKRGIASSTKEKTIRTSNFYSIAKVEAEERAYALAEEQNQFYVLDETHESVNLANTRNLTNPEAISEQNLYVTQTEVANTNESNQMQVAPVDQQQLIPTQHVQRPTPKSENLNPAAPDWNRAQYSTNRENKHLLGRVLESQEY